MKHRRHIILNDIHIDIVENLIDTIPGVNSFSEAIRYALLKMEGNSIGEIDNKKINAMSKQLDILVEMVAGGMNQLDVNAIGKKEDTYIYQDAKNIIENNIQRSMTQRKYSDDKNKKITSEKKENNSMSQKRELIF